MHEDSYNLMRAFAEKYCDGTENVLDVGSLDVNGTYRDIFPNYTGMDVVEGDNVDLVLDYQDGYIGKYNTDKKYDVVICGNVIEHVANPFGFVHALANLVSESGYLCIITPTDIHLHDHPKDYWRIMPDGMELLMKNAGMTVEAMDMIDGLHNDLICVAEHGCI